MRRFSRSTNTPDSTTSAGRILGLRLLVWLCSTALVSASPALAATVVVDTASDLDDGDTSSISALIGTPGGDGVISLREAITAANNTANSGGPDEIHFSIGSGLQTITPGSGLPYLLDPVILDATTQPGYAGDPIIQLNGSGATGATAGIAIRANGCTVRGFIVHSSDNTGIEIDGSTGAGDNNIIQNNWVGINAAGSARPNDEYGIMITSGADHNQIGGTGANDGNVIAGNANAGLIIRNTGSNDNTVQGNFFGLGADGVTVVPNDADGILIMDAAADNIIGGSTAAARNVISGNAQTSVRVKIGSGSGNVIAGNYIGVKADGTTAAGNLNDGVTIKASNTMVGGADPGAGNIIANHVAGTSVGIWVTGGTTGVSILGNSIYNNKEDGIGLGPPWGPVPNDVGDADTGNNNLQNYPVLTAAVTDNVGSVYIAGTLNSIASTTYRLEFFSSATGDGTGYGEGQTFLGHVDVTTDGSGNATFGTTLSATVPTGDVISSTATKKTGESSYTDTSQFSLNMAAVTGSLTVTTTNDLLNGDTSSIAALIGDDGGDGISLREAIDAANRTSNGTGPDEIHFDIADTDPGYQTSGADHWWRIAPSSALPLVENDGLVIDGSTQTTNRGDTNARGPEIELYGASAGSNSDGLRLSAGNSTVRGLVINSFLDDGIGLSSDFNTIEGCYIGTNATGTAAMGNADRGIDISNVASNTVGGTTAAERNLISGNGDDGITVWNSGATLNMIMGNYLGLNATGTGPIGNAADGIVLGGGASNNTVGGTTPAERNVISGNSDGVEIDNDSDDNKVSGNYIGTNAAGTAAVPNSRHGVVLYDGASGTQVGGAVAGQGNLISGNTEYGVVIDGNGGAATTLNTIAGNLIGTDKDGLSGIPNTSGGIHFFDGATVNTIGGLTAGERNVISANTGDGIVLRDANTTSNVIVGNYIGTDITGTFDLGNTTDGIVLRDGAQSNTIGGTTVSARNIIAGNDNDGIWITGTNTESNTVQGNWIGIGSDGSAIGNSYHGIGIEWDASNNTIGGTTAGAGNRIGNSVWDGIAVANGTGNGNALLGNEILNSGNLGIDLVDDGVTANDPDDGDGGLNDLQNYPVLTSAVTDEATTITIDGTLDSAASTTFRVEFFASAAANASGNGEGETYLGATDVATDTNGDASFSAPLLIAVTSGKYISATATDPAGNTSEFAANVVATVAASSEISGIVFEDADYAGTATDWDGGTVDVALANVDVELYDGTDSYLASFTTAGDGSFTFTGLNDGTYKVRVRSATIGDADTPPAGGLHPTVPGTWPYPLAEMTWGQGSALIGGQDPSLDDTATGDNAGPGDTRVAVTVSGADVNNVNFGFNYDLITNNADDVIADSVRSKQGSLRQFIKNSNAIAGVNKSWFQNTLP